MTDEIDKLRRRIAELEGELVDARPRSAVELELRRRGLPASVIPDAVELLKAEHAPAAREKLTSATVWFTATDPERKTLAELIDAFQESKAYLFPSTQRAEPGPTYNGRPVPMDQMTDEELAAQAGEFPKATTPEEGYTDEQLASMNLMDRLAYLSGAEPKIERDDRGIDEVNRELEARAEHREDAAKQQIESGAVRMFETKKAWGKS